MLTLIMLVNIMNGTKTFSEPNTNASSARTRNPTIAPATRRSFSGHDARHTVDAIATFPTPNSHATPHASDATSTTSHTARHDVGRFGTTVDAAAAHTNFDGISGDASTTAWVSPNAGTPYAVAPYGRNATFGTGSSNLKNRKQCLVECFHFFLN